ncbi:hypothetical protein F5Y10DRAFT_285459 [Nemania abortiva]|nr:hypothetical protein F5Y10DRAFT_285459 [Nemania abortiva]
MMSMWFLLPDFTFTTEGPLRLGMVIPHWSSPTTVLADLGSNTSGIKLPPRATTVEPNYFHTRSESRSNNLSIWLKFESLASASAGNNYSKKNIVEYSKADHETHTFKDPLAPEIVAAITNFPTVRAHIESGMFGKRPFYIVTGVRIATSPFKVTKERNSSPTLEAERSGASTGTKPTMAVGGKVGRGSQSTVADSYDRVPDIVFAYQLHVVRTRRAGFETRLYSHRKAFFIGASGKKEELIFVEGSTNEIDGDLEENVKYETERIGEEICVYPVK